LLPGRDRNSEAAGAPAINLLGAPHESSVIVRLVSIPQLPQTYRTSTRRSLDRIGVRSLASIGCSQPGHRTMGSCSALRCMVSPRSRGRNTGASSDRLPTGRSGARAHVVRGDRTSRRVKARPSALNALPITNDSRRALGSGPAAGAWTRAIAKLRRRIQKASSPEWHENRICEALSTSWLWPRAFEPSGSLGRLTLQQGKSAMSERRITQLFGLILGGVFAGCLVLNAFAY